ncbi:TetR/AcrR family transcriptional regulator [Pseudovibrio sp. Alg231-02]|uniref:TetR/AcrR family transcriptional regulator n=1 Tax=Pseudovibrio sp. Alg231-02 TaxID=1922223 RepID=UPI000D558ACA|nr:TetR/AcrR family transcriptional regulator [Pseudovibrio sp. Alg231-02]
MIGKREAKKAAMREKLLSITRQHVVQHGLANIRARDITAEAGCALGSLYTAFDDLDDLIIQVNSQTLQELGERITQSVQAKDTPADVLVTAAVAYMEFAYENRNLWEALFDHKMKEGIPVPEWHLQEHLVLFKNIAEPLGVLRSDLPPEELATQAKTLFAAIHGNVLLSVQGRFIAVEKEALKLQIVNLTQIIIKGMTR